MPDHCAIVAQLRAYRPGQVDDDVVEGTVGEHMDRYPVTAGRFEFRLVSVSAHGFVASTLSSVAYSSPFGVSGSGSASSKITRCDADRGIARMNPRNSDQLVTSR